MASRNVQLQIQLKNAKSISDLEGVIKEINKDLKAVDVSSEAFTQLSETAKKANASLTDVKDSLKNISSEKQLDSVAKMGGALAASLSLATIAASHFGQETQESVQKAIRTATELNAVINSIKPIMEGLSATNRKAFAEWIAGFRASGIGATLFGNSVRTAISVTGIGLFVVALGTVVAYWDEIKESIGLTNKEQKKIIAAQEKMIERQREILRGKEAELDFEIQLAKAKNASAVEVSDLEIKKLKERERAEGEIYKTLIERYTTEKDNQIANYKAYLEQAKVVKEIQNQIKVAEEIRNQNLIKEGKETKAALDKRTAELDKAYKEELEKIEKVKQARIAAIRERAELELQLEKPLADSIEKSRQKVNDKAEASFAATLKHIKDLTKHADGFDVEEFKKKIDEATPYINTALKGINDVSNSLVQGIQRQFDQLSLQLDAINADYQTSTELRKSYEQELQDAQGLRREQLLASLDEERKKEMKLADERKKIISEQIKAKNRQQNIEWKNSLLNSIVQGALAVVQSLPNIGLSVAVGVLSAIQTGIIAANRPAPILAATGGFTGPGGSIDSTGERKAGIYQLHSNEWISPRWMVEDKKIGPIISQLEAIRSNQIGSMAIGGFPDPPAIAQSAGVQFTPETMKQIIESAKIYTVITEARDGLNKVEFIESRSTLAA